MTTVSETVSFSQLCELLEKVESLGKSIKGPKRKDPGRRREICQKFFDDWRRWEATTDNVEVVNL